MGAVAAAARAAAARADPQGRRRDAPNTRRSAAAIGTGKANQTTA
ncbi:hypothetical protein TcasGA2_TC001354 [Tribolium castaneum]|uniref:Uncharacterized protein n=1 Tax=Tribolium castaneum TaxID=7070 RepID=D6WCB8_TRICA|nr:hypothetical protein TcasGA2_TC001354 [Tribolium castaneum]